MIYTLETSVVIDAVRQPDELVRLKQFLEWALPFTALSSVVVSELVRGVRTAEARAFLKAEIVGPFERRRRIVTPSNAAWTRTGELLGRAGGSTLPPIAQNDLLIGCMARELGWLVLTRDRDFLSIQAHGGGPWIRVHRGSRLTAGGRAARLQGDVPRETIDAEEQFTDDQQALAVRLVDAGTPAVETCRKLGITELIADLSMDKTILREALENDGEPSPASGGGRLGPDGVSAARAASAARAGPRSLEPWPVSVARAPAARGLADQSQAGE